MASGRNKNTVFTASGDRFIAEWNLDTLQPEPFAAKLSQPAYAVLFIEEFELLIAGNSVGGFHVIDVGEKKELHLFNIHTNGIYDLAFDKLRNQLIVAGGDGVLSIWSIPDFQLLRKIPLSGRKLRQLAISETKDFVAVACGDGSIRLLDLVLFNEIKNISAHENGVSAVSWHPTKPVLVSGGKDALMKCWNIKDDYAEVLSLPAHNFAIYSVAFHGSICATASRDKTIKIWDSASFEPLQKLDVKSGGHSHSVNKVLWMGQKLVSCGDDRQVIVWKIN